jgi:hypothetical protein
MNLPELSDATILRYADEEANMNISAGKPLLPSTPMRKPLGLDPVMLVHTVSKKNSTSKHLKQLRTAKAKKRREVAVSGQ